MKMPNDPPEDEDAGEGVVGPTEPSYQPIDDTSTYAQTLSNTVLALIQWQPIDADERLFTRMQIKRLVDTQIALLALYLDETK